MPIYEYRCQNCETIVEAIQSFSAPPLTRCDNCGGDLRKLISRSAFHLKGGGWYSDHYGLKSGKDSKESSGSTGAASAASSETKSEPVKSESKSTESKADSPSAKPESSASKSSNDKTVAA